uniref:PVC-type heme-binding CxxCH protein n=1 Tax=Ningiella ruwaisensis TaxID=2364274 RepID=UPI0019D55D47|nr:PVC-type heme-binding CxxCH protein [Ningiella ruwaisensis]
MKYLARTLIAVSFVFSFCFAHANGIDHLVFEPGEDIANGKHIVLVSGDEEYRSEESMPMLAKILTEHHGFKTTVLFAIDRETGVINPNDITNIAHLESLKDADLMVLATRWRILPGEQLQHFLDFINDGKPIIAIRTATHPFNNDDMYGGYDWQNFGLDIVGENWLYHHGIHKKEGGRSVNVEEHADHPILNSVDTYFMWSDIYGIENLTEDATVLQLGAVTESLDPNSPNLEGKKNNPMMPLSWLKPYSSPNGKNTGQVFTTTGGAAYDLQEESARRMLVNAAYYLLDMEVPEKANVSYVDPFEPSFYGFQDTDYFVKRGLQVSDFAMGSSARSILTIAELKALGVETRVELKDGDTVLLLGNGLPERMLNHGFFESEIYSRHADKDITIRTLAKPGYTPGFRPHPSRNSQWAFPGAERYHPDKLHHSGEGFHPTPDEWLYDIKPDVIIAFFGFNESFDGPEGLDNYREELYNFINHSLANKYADGKIAKLVLVSPIAFQDLSDKYPLPDGKETNKNLKAYTELMKDVANERGIQFVDLYTPTKAMFESSDEQLTVNGAHLNKQGYARLAPILTDEIFTAADVELTEEKFNQLLQAVLDKNWYWFKRYQMPNGVHVDGRRFEPYGVDNYPQETIKVVQMTENRDRQIWHILNDKPFDLVAADASTQKLDKIESNVSIDNVQEYKYGQDALDTFTVAEGFEIELFASEVDFPNLANPAQMAFDNQGRLWVSTLESYPHYKPGDAKPDDKILIYEDTDKDGKADKEIVFADGLNLPIGFEITEHGVYVSQAPNLVLLQDTDGDDKADTYEIILSGFDTHDTHHAISGFIADPFGGIIMQEGVFLHSNIETAYGPIRAVNAGFYRFDPRTQRLQRLVQNRAPNPWGVVFDEWGQNFFMNTSDPSVYWMLPVELKTRYGQLSLGTDTLIESAHRVRPTSGIEFVYSQHFPEEMQGDFILNNVIGFLGAKQHTLNDEGTGYVSNWRQDLYTSTDPNFRPVDLEFAADGSLYVVDWHNQLIGHMQHNARDPLRDHAHGRIYRVTHKERPLSEEVPVDGESLDTLFSYLKSPDHRLRYRVRREIREHDFTRIQNAKKDYIASLDKAHPDYDRHLLEALWLSRFENKQDKAFAEKLMTHENYKVRAAAVKAIRLHLYEYDTDEAIALMKKAAGDEHGRVRLEAIAGISWIDDPKALPALYLAGEKEGAQLGPWMRTAFLQTVSNLGGTWTEQVAEVENEAEHLSGIDRERYFAGKEIYFREGYCVTCHQPDGNGLPMAGFPPISGTEWVTGDPERLTDIILHGLMKKIWVKGEMYAGHVPMTAFGNMLNDEEVASVLTYIRNNFENRADPVSPELVKKVRASTNGPRGFWTAKELFEKYPTDRYPDGEGQIEE